ncbi:MAG: DUF1415 domain-containing protein [Saprospiraceae bacterium]
MEKNQTEISVIEQTIAWIKSVVIGCNFCPFAAKAMLKNSIRYVVLPEGNMEKALEELGKELSFLNVSDEIETTLIIFPHHLADLASYLELVELAEGLISSLGYDGVYQVASFHPDYLFEGSDNDDPANYTNRSVYPMLHILREDSVTKVVDHFADIEEIPQRNIEFAREKGLRYMQLLRATCI